MVFMIFLNRNYTFFMKVLNILTVVPRNVLCLQMWFELKVSRALKSLRQRAIGRNSVTEWCHLHFLQRSFVGAQDCVFNLVCKDDQSCEEPSVESCAFCSLWLSKSRPLVGVQLLSHVQLFAIPWTAAHQASLSFTISWSLLNQIHVHWVTDAIQPSRLLSPPSPPALNLSHHQGLFQWVGSLH